MLFGLFPPEKYQAAMERVNGYPDLGKRFYLFPALGILMAKMYPVQDAKRIVVPGQRIRAFPGQENRIGGRQVNQIKGRGTEVQSGMGFEEDLMQGLVVPGQVHLPYPEIRNAF